MYNTEITKELRELLEKERYTKAHLSRLLGMNRQTLSDKINRGQMQWGLVKTIAEKLGYECKLVKKQGLKQRISVSVFQKKQKTG